MSSSSHTDMKKRRERVLLFIIVILIALFAAIEFRLVQFISPITTYKNILVFTIININLLLILVLSFLVIRHLVKVFFEERDNILGARLKTRLVTAFIFISLLPTTLLFFISYQFLQTSLAYWFDEKIEKSLERAISVGRNYYQQQVDQLKGVNLAISEGVERSCITANGAIETDCVDNLISPPFGIVPSSVLTMVQVHAVELYDMKGNTVYSKLWFPLTQDLPPPDFSTVKSEKKPSVFVLEHTSGTILRIISPIKNGKGTTIALLSTAKLIPGSTMEELDSIKQGYEEYKQLKLFQDPLKSTLLATLFLITLLIIFVSIWFAVKIANGITMPLQMLADATQRVAQGDLDFELKTQGRDELQALVQAFNTMTADLKEARAKAERASRELLKSFQELENRKKYIEMLLENITAGVISIDKAGKITTINRAAGEILGIDPQEMVGTHYSRLLDPELSEEFEYIRSELLFKGTETLKRPIKVEVEGVSRSLLVNFSVLRDRDGKISGILVVFDDLTDLERIQRIAAWRDVARRIAHEVKNPLTPIKLSAQRLRKKLANALNEKQKSILDRCTETIISQTNELKRLVDEFSRFARMPAPVFKKANPEEILEEVISLYSESPVEIVLDIAPDLPSLSIDPEQIKRVFINIIDNAISVKPEGRVDIKVYLDGSKKMMIFDIMDQGPGVKKQDMERIFEPYFTKKKGGTGLGLAIAKSIIEAHDGDISVEQNRPSGLIFHVALRISK